MQTSKSTEKEKNYKKSMDILIRKSIDYYGGVQVLDSFSKFVSRQALTRFLAQVRIFEHIKHIHGSIIECGVYAGQGLMSWAQLSAIHEPVGGVTREVFGFDTFSGFPSVHENDINNTRQVKHEKGDLSISNIYENILECISLYDQNRFLWQFPKVHLIKGDFLKTSSKFFDDYPHVVPALLYLDFDLYEPTKKALEIFYPRMPKGSVIVFDELNDTAWPGESKAVYEVLDIKQLRFNKIEFEPKISYTVIE